MVEQLEADLQGVLDEIRLLEEKLDVAPDPETATRLHGANEVARRLLGKLEAARELEHVKENATKRDELEAKHQAMQDEVEVLYREAAQALRVALDRTEKAFTLRQEMSRTRSFILKVGGLSPKVPDSFWPRNRELLDKFRDSVLVMGEP